MSSSSLSPAIAGGQPAATASALRSLYFVRAAFSIIWVSLVFIFANTSAGLADALLIIYPAWDVLGTFIDIRANRGGSSQAPQYANAAISTFTTGAVAIALQKGIPEALIVFGIWAILTGAIQLILGLRRKKSLGGQWPMIISGGAVYDWRQFVYPAGRRPANGNFQPGRICRFRSFLLPSGRLSLIPYKAC